MLVFKCFCGECMWQLWRNFKGWWCGTSNVNYSRISHKRPPKCKGLVVAYEGRTARAKFSSQPRMGWYVYSKKIIKVTFSYQLLVVVLTQSLAILCDSSFTEVHLIRWRYKLVVKKFYLCTWLLYRNVPKTSDEQKPGNLSLLLKGNG